MASNAHDVDPRPQMGVSLDQIERQVTAAGPADLAASTPCGEYDVELLMAHVIAVLRKIATVGRGGDMTTVTDPAVDVSGREEEELRRARADLASAWADEAALDEEHTVAWGTMTGRELLDAYTHEFTVHAWDLARATGRERDLDPVLADAALAWFTDNVPPDDRSEGGPFGPVIEVDEDADIYTRLAGFVGRSVP